MNERFCRSAASAAAAGLLLAATAWAHPKIVRSRPAPDAALARAPAKVQVWFDEELDTRGSRLTVWNEAGESVGRGDGRVSLDDRRLIEVGLKPLPPGRYTVKWRAMADDDKGVIRGEFAFRVASPR